MRIDYAAAIDGDREIEVSLSNGQTITLKKLRLGGFIQLRSVEPQLLDALKARDAEKVAECYGRYVRTSTNKTVSGRDMFRVYAAIAMLNQLEGTLPFMESKIKPDAVELIKYPSRAYALIVHKIASEYHWSREEIMNLRPEEVMVYIQELMSDAWHMREWEWEMAGFGWYKDDKGIMHRNQYPAPDWLSVISAEVKKVKMLKSMLPMGTIIDMGGYGLHGTGNKVDNVGEQSDRNSRDDANSSSEDSVPAISAS